MSTSPFALWRAISFDRTIARRVVRFGLGGMLGLLAACANTTDSQLVVAPPPSDPIRLSGNEPNTASAPVALNLIVSHDVPALPPRQPAPAAPSAQHVWIADHWIWRDYEYEWREGHWELPPRSGAHWVAPRWVQRGRVYRFYVGHWN